MEVSQRVQVNVGKNCVLIITVLKRQTDDVDLGGQMWELDEEFPCSIPGKTIRGNELFYFGSRFIF